MGSRLRSSWYWGAASVLLLWTNPVAPDLRYIRVCSVNSDSLTTCAIYEGRCVPGDANCDSLKLYPALPDSIIWQLPCASAPRQWWFYLEAGDTAGNFSGPSNVVTVIR